MGIKTQLNFNILLLLIIRFARFLVFMLFVALLRLPPFEYF